MEVDHELMLLLKRSEGRLIDSLLESSEEYLLDILYTDPHPSHLTLALLAQAVYTEKKPQEADQAYGERLPLPEDWRLLTTASNSDFLNKYFGAAFFNAGSQQVVVAHRGTIPTKVGPLYTDVVGIFFNKYTSCMNSSVTFVDYVSQVIHHVNSKSETVKRRYNLTITGHSLGGWLAQVTTFTARYVKVSDGALIKNTSDGVHAKAVVFDSPGAKDMLHKLQDMHYPRYETEFLDRLNMLDITVYVSAPNLVNTCGAHLRTVYRVFIDLSQYKVEDLESWLYAEKTHKIGNFVEALKENSANVMEVLDWAKDSNEYKSLFRHQTLNLDNNFHVDSKKNKIIEYFEEITKRYQVVPSEPQIIFQSNLNAFSDAEVQILDYLVIIQKQTDITILNEFLLNEKLELKSGKLFADFEINHKTRTISCKSKQLLEEVSARVKQLMRWKGPEFSKAVEEQSRTTDLIYRREGQNYALQKSRLNFTDSYGLRDFLLSHTEQTFCIVTQDSSFEMTRLHNIVSSMPDPPNLYTSEGHYTFVTWPRLQFLFNIYGSPVDQNDLMMVDATLSPPTSSELLTFLNKYALNNSSPILKKLIFILSHPIDTINVKTFNANRKIKLTDLTAQSQAIIFTTKMINFNGNVELSFREILGKNYSLSDFNEVISSNCLNSIVIKENYVFKIKDTRPTNSDLQSLLIKTNINITSKEHVLKCVDLPNSLVVFSGLNRGDLETGAGWEQLRVKEILLAEGDEEQFFKETCDENQDKTIYLLEVSGDAKAEIRCKNIFDRAFYVSRKFRHRASINLQKFAKSKYPDDLLVISCEEHKTLLLEMTKDCKEREAFKENVLIANTQEQEVDIIHKYSHKNIHFMKVDETDEQNESVEKYPSEIEWRFSHGSAKSLLPCMTTEFLKPIDELSLSKTERNLVVITDEPGMGKTTSLARLSRLLEAPWVIYMEFKLFKKQIDSLSDQLTPQNVATFLLSASGSDSDSTPNLAEGLLLYFLNSKACSKRVVLMFDGFDEIDDYVKNKDSSKDKIVKLLTFLQSKPTIQVFLTARKYLKESLETNLSQLSTSFVTLTAQEQLDFLFTFWRSFLPLELGEYGEEEEGRLKEYVGEVLRQAKVVLGPDMNRFMGVPLQLRMLAEIFRPQSHLLRQSPELLLTQINIVSAPNLYKLYVDLKYQIYLQEKTSKGDVLPEEEINLYLKGVTETHGKLAFKLFFPEFYIQNFEDIGKEWVNTLNRFGLGEIKRDGDFQFVHRTYAEYCCAEMVVHWLNQPESFNRYGLFNKIIIPQILLHPDSKIIRMFLNQLLHETTMSKTDLNAKCISRLWNEDSSIFSNQEHQTVLHIAIIENNVYIATLLLSGFSAEEAFVSLIQQYDHKVNTAINFLNKPTLHKFRENELVLDTMTTNILQHIGTCSDENKVNIFFAILFNRKVSKSDETAEKFFYERFFNRHDIKASQVSAEEETIITNLFYSDINKYISCTERIFDRVKEVELVIKPFTVAVVNNNVKYVRYILFETLKNNVERYCFLLMKHKDQYMRTVLHIAIAWRHLDIVRLLVEQTAVPFTLLMAQRDKYKNIPLHTATKGRGGLDITKYLVEERGADINTHSGRGKSVLMCAALGGELLTVKYIVERGGDIHATDMNGRTVLHYAAGGKHLSVVEYFLQQGLDPDRVNRVGFTALTEASLYKRWNMVRLLLERGVDVNADGGEALNVAIWWDAWSIVETLINKGAATKESLIDKNLSEFKVKYPNYEFKKE